MAENKRSFLLYTDVHFTVKKLTDEQSGKLFKHILAYVNDENPIINDLILEIAFEPIKQSLKRDLKRYEAICLRNKENGSKGGRPKHKPKKPSGLNGNPENPNEPDNDSDSDSDNGIDKDNDKEKKIKKNIVPTFEDFKTYALENYPLVNIKSLELKYKSWVENNWRDGNNKKIENWKSKLLNTIPYLNSAGQQAQNPKMSTKYL